LPLKPGFNKRKLVSNSQFESRSRSVDPSAKPRELTQKQHEDIDVEDSIDKLYEHLGGQVNGFNVHLNQQMIKFEATDNESH
jgi:hypothetical protein